MKIQKIQASEILDSRGNPTVDATVYLEDGSIGWAAVPSGASTGSYEAVELRDNDKKRFEGKGTLTAVYNIENEISKKLVGMDAEDQESIDKTMIDLDGTENKARLGANAILAVSLACAKASANSKKIPLYQYLTKFNPDFNGTYTMPITQMNIMNGGKHANWSTDIQEYMILPVGALNVREGIRMCAEVYQQLKKVLKSKNYSIGIGDEGGYAPGLSSNKEPFELMSEAIKNAGYELGKDIFFGIDSASTEFFKDGIYNLAKEGKQVSSQQLADFYISLMKDYPIISFEDVFSEDDWDGFKNFTNLLQGKGQVIGDDLYVTNIKRLQKGIEEKTTNSILIKLNQIGTLTETIKAILMARQNNMSSVVSHRSGETEDSFIADLVVAMGTGQIKTGAPCRSERVVKYNRLMSIEREQEGKTVFAKFPFL